jgi:hypothetical protein
MTDDDLLAPNPTANNALRSAIFARTSHRIRVVRRWRLVKQIGLGLLLFTGGMGVMSLHEVPQQATRIVIVRQPAPVVETQKSEPKRITPSELELEAERTFVKVEAAKRFREAGDRYFREQGDYQAALRCYRNFMIEADPTELIVSPNDTSLLTALKQHRTTEN